MQRPKEMSKAKSFKSGTTEAIEKSLTGIIGFDEITLGGIPQNRSTLIVGPAGSGKTLFGMQFLLHGVLNNEPGLFIAFEESEQDLIKNLTALGFDLTDSIKKNELILQHIQLDRTNFDVSGDYNLDGLYIQIEYKIDKFKIKRIVIDTIEVLFSQFTEENIIRYELQRLFRRLAKKNVTAVITGEKGKENITRYGLEEYVADCVILLENRVSKELATRYLRILKYRGSPHGSNEYPFIIDNKGILLSPITSITLDYKVPRNFVSSGITDLDEVLNGKGYYNGGSVLINGVAGSGKTSLAAAFAESLCKDGKKCLYFAFEESSDQIIRNMKSININLEPWKKKGTLKFHSIRPSVYGLESHLIKMVEMIEEFKPDGIIFDPISNLGLIGSPHSVKLMLARLINYLKVKKITAIMTSLLHENTSVQQEGVSSLMDVWILLKTTEYELEQCTLLVVKKSRGMPHSRQMREVLMNRNGITLQDVYLGSGKIVVGSTRIVQAMKEEIEHIEKNREYNQKLQRLKEEQETIEAHIEALSKKLNLIKDDEHTLASTQKQIQLITSKGTKRIGKIRTPASIFPNKGGKADEQ